MKHKKDFSDFFEEMNKKISGFDFDFGCSGDDYADAVIQLAHAHAPLTPWYSPGKNKGGEPLEIIHAMNEIIDKVNKEGENGIQRT